MQLPASSGGHRYQGQQKKSQYWQQLQATPPEIRSKCSSVSSSLGRAGRTKWTTVSVFSTARTSTPSGTAMPYSLSTCAGFSSSRALNSSSAHARATIWAYSFCCWIGSSLIVAPPVKCVFSQNLQGHCRKGRGYEPGC